eukprot:gb/GECG01009096.1/.p1 GENE.gb/GECG01009096.1/~~gb/GECG01009096.1/.p1  ORF type:complete len:339 (+),score=51.60 gb/GECG01009096.1/:1-1017(+)
MLLQDYEARKRKAEELMNRQKTSSATHQEVGQCSSLSSVGRFQFGQVNEVMSAEEYTQALSVAGQKKFVMVTDWYAPWCGPCQFISQSVSEFAERFTEVLFLKVNCDNLPQLASAYQVRSFPTFFVHVRNQLHKKFSGANAKQLYDEIAEAEGVLEENLLAEAVQMSLQEEESSKHGEGASASGSSTAQEHVTQQWRSDDSFDQRIRTSLEELRSKLSTKTFEGTSALMLRCINNVYDNPAEPKYRKIKTTNKAFRERLAPYPPALDVLKSVGFEEKSGHMCFRMDPSTGEKEPLSREDLSRLDKAKKLVSAYNEGCKSDPFAVFEQLTEEEDNERRK